MKQKLLFLSAFILIVVVHYFLLFSGETTHSKLKQESKKLSPISSSSKKKQNISFSKIGINEDELINTKGKDKVTENEFVYCLPFKPGNSYFVSQTKGRTHKGSGENAIDFVIPEGAGIHAARSGLVVTAKDIFSESGRTDEFLGKANHIVIKHNDSTYAMYAHLSHKGVKVSVGEYVEVGTHIGYSGNTGYSNMAHLHFEVFKGFGEDHVTIPVAFMTSNSLRERLEAKKRYKVKVA